MDGLPEPPEESLCDEMRGDCDYCPAKEWCPDSYWPVMPDVPEPDWEAEEMKVPIELLEGEDG